MKEVNTQKLCTFELGTQEGINFPIWILVGFRRRERQDSQNFSKDNFHRPPVTSAHNNIGTDKNPVSAILLNYDDDDYIQGYGRINEAFRALTKDDIPKSFIPDNDFRSSDKGIDSDHKL